MDLVGKPLVPLVLICGVGVLTLVLVMVFTKRQISRVTLRSRRGAHYPIGQNAPRHLQREINRRLEHTGVIKYEPKLLSDGDYRLTRGDTNGEKCAYLYRLKALDAYRQFDETVMKVEKRLKRLSTSSVREYVQQVRESPITPMKGASSALCKAFIDAYEHARYSFKIFGEAEYNNYMALLHELLSSLKQRNYKKKKLAQQFSQQSSSSHKGSFDRLSSTSTNESRHTQSSIRGHRQVNRDRGTTEVKFRKPMDSAPSSQTNSERKILEHQQL